jgi:hypothetical protein
MQRTLTTAQLAAELGLSPATVQLYARDHHIPCEETPGGHRRYNLDEVRVALAARKGARASRDERRTAAAEFGPFRRARGAQLLRSVRTSDADVAARTAPAEQPATPTVVDAVKVRSAALDLLSGAVGVHLTVAR